MLSEVFTHRLLSQTGDGFFEAPGVTSWGPQQNPVLVQSIPEQEPLFYNFISSSDNSTPITNHPDDIITNTMEERKRRRKISNRESARRSRVRKQKHLENMRSQLNRLKTGNRDLVNRLRVVNLHGQLVRQENRRLVSESVMLEQKLRDIRHALNLRLLHEQLLPCNNNVTYNYEQNPPSLIT